MNRQNSLFGLIVAGAIALLLVVFVGAYWLLPKKAAKLITPASQPHTGVLVSKLSPAMVTLLINPEELRGLTTKQQFNQIKNTFLDKGKINYPVDIKPWLGQEVTLAVTSIDIDHDSENGLQPGYLMILTTKQPAESREFLDLLFSQRAIAGADLAVERYKGVKLFSDKQDTALAGAVLDNYVLLANHPQILRETINNLQAPNLNLSSTGEYQQAIQQLNKDAVGFAFFNLPLLTKWQGLESSTLIYNSQITSLIFKPQGFLTETTFLTNTQVTPPSIPLSQPVGALKYIPENAGLVISGANLSNLGNSNLAQLWQQATTTIYGSPAEALARWGKPLLDFQQKWGLNLSEDVLKWVVGEYAIALFPNETQQNPDWLLIVEKTPEVTAGINRLNEIAATHHLNVSTLNLNQHLISAWTELTATTQNTAEPIVTAKVQGAHTTVGNYEIFASDLETMNKIFTSNIKPLTENANFQASITTIPQPNQGYIYLDWQQSHTWLEQQQPILQFLEFLAKPLFNDLRSLTISSYGNESGTLKGGIFWQLDN
ncbi:MAG TPA: DUF3352 domain-containing protein [Nostocaceae cyanobacterium]|nr:DUF3352 domain-containing protein [Nostocaceae cyanobacterium]